MPLVLISFSIMFTQRCRQGRKVAGRAVRSWRSRRRHHGRRCRAKRADRSRQRRRARLRRARPGPARRGTGGDAWQPRNGDACAEAQRAHGADLRPCRDQRYVAAAVQEWGAGRALPQDAGVAAISAVAGRCCARPHSPPRQESRRRYLWAFDGATNAGDDVEAVLASKQSRLPPHVGVSGQREKRATSSTWRV
jgi:hypothetical protein